MRDAAKGYLALAGSLTEVTRQRATAAAKALVSQGEATAGQVSTLVDDLLAQSRQNREAVAALVTYEVDRTLGRIGLASEGEVAALVERVRALEAEVQQLRGSATKPPATTSPATTSPGKKAAAKKSPAARTPAAKAPAKKSAAKKSAAKKSTAKAPATTSAATSPAKKSAAKQAPAKKSAATSPAKKSAAKKAPAQQAAATSSDTPTQAP